MAEETKQPQQLQRLETERQLLCARFSPDGTHLLAGGMDAKLHRWREAEVIVEKKEKTKDGEKVSREKKIEWQPLPPVTGHNAWVSTLGIHPKD